MEILLELVLGGVIELFGELFLYLVSEVLSKLFCELCLPPSGSVKSLLLRASFSGILLGAISLVIVPTPFMKSHSLRMLLLCTVPLFVGTLTMLAGNSAQRNNRPRSEYDGFVFGALFALCFGLARFAAQLFG